MFHVLSHIPDCRHRHISLKAVSKGVRVGRLVVFLILILSHIISGLSIGLALSIRINTRHILPRYSIYGIGSNRIKLTGLFNKSERLAGHVSGFSRDGEKMDSAVDRLANSPV